MLMYGYQFSSLRNLMDSLWPEAWNQYFSLKDIGLQQVG